MTRCRDATRRFLTISSCHKTVPPTIYIIFVLPRDWGLPLYFATTEFSLECSSRGTEWYQPWLLVNDGWRISNQSCIHDDASTRSAWPKWMMFSWWWCKQLWPVMPNRPVFKCSLYIYNLLLFFIFQDARNRRSGKMSTTSGGRVTIYKSIYKKKSLMDQSVRNTPRVSWNTKLFIKEIVF